jgi:hypothetical protein
MDLDLRIVDPHHASDQDASIWSLKISLRKNFCVPAPLDRSRLPFDETGVQRCFIEAAFADSAPLSYSDYCSGHSERVLGVITLHPPVLMGFASAAQGKNP